MNIKKLIMDTLKPLNIPVYAMTYDGKEDTYIIITEYNQAPRITANDEEVITKYFYQVDVFSDEDYTLLVDAVRNRLKQAGFGRMFESETYDSDVSKFRKIMRFNYDNILGGH